VNTALVWLYWNIGRRIREEVLKEKRAEYGKEILSTLSKELAAEYGQGFSEPNLRHMVRFAEVFADEKILYALCRGLSWSHFRSLLSLARTCVSTRRSIRSVDFEPRKSSSAIGRRAFSLDLN
jgi:hypothetical protein